MPRERQRRVGAHGRTHLLARELAETILQLPLDSGERSRVAEGTERLFGQMAKEIANVEGAVALAVQVEVDQVEALTVDDHLITVEVTMNRQRGRARDALGEPLACGAQPRDSVRQPWTLPGDAREAVVEDPQLIADRVCPPRGDTGPMELVRSLRDPSRKARAIGAGEEVCRRAAWSLALKPHPEVSDRRDRLRHRDSVVARIGEAGAPERVRELVSGVAEPPRTHLPEQSLVVEALRPLDADVVLDEAASSWLVANDLDPPHADEAVLTGETRQATLEAAFDLVGVECQTKRGERRVVRCAERIVDDDHAARISVQSESRPST